MGGSWNCTVSLVDTTVSNNKREQAVCYCCSRKSKHRVKGCKAFRKCVIIWVALLVQVYQLCQQLTKHHITMYDNNWWFQSFNVMFCVMHVALCDRSFPMMQYIHLTLLPCKVLYSKKLMQQLLTFQQDIQLFTPCSILSCAVTNSHSKWVVLPTSEVCQCQWSAVVHLLSHTGAAAGDVDSVVEGAVWPTGRR